VTRAWYRASLLTAVVIAVDQATKALVRAGIDRGARHKFLPAIDLVNVRNRGIAFGLFTQSGVLLTVLTIAALLLLLAYFARHAERPLVWLPTGLLLGGALGNMLDRLVRGAVTDFIDVPLWPSFNVADMSITLGVLSLLYVIEEGAGRHAPA
jgi:signal peptidase II